VLNLGMNRLAIQTGTFPPVLSERLAAVDQGFAQCADETDFSSFRALRRFGLGSI
jgi:hypothetical protein